MIFKQIDSSVDKTRKTLALFNKDWNAYKSNWQNANGIKGKIGSIFTSSNTNTSIISNEQVQILRNWNNAVAHGCTSQETFNRIIADADDNTKMYFAGLNKGKGSIEGLKKTQNIATQSTIGLTIAQTALNMAISLGLTALISLIVKGYDKLANSVENCKERVDDLISSYKSALETANNNANRVEELADKYEKLSKGVNSLGENVSLTNEEYEEYNSLVNEIAEMFPTLVQGWTDEGTAVLNLKGNIEQLRDAYKEAQQEAYNLLIVSGKDSDGNDIIKQWEDTHDTGFWADLLDLGADDVGGGIAVSDALKQLKAIQNMTAEEYREIERITGAGSRKEIAGLSNIEKDIGYGSYLYKALGLDSTVTDEDFRKAQRQARALIQTYNAEIESALSDVETLANAYLMTNEDYDKLDEQSKTAASMLVNSLNADIANTFSSKEDVGSYVDKIVQSILSNSKAKDALKGLFTMDTSDMSVDEIKKQTDSYINTIAEVLKEDPIELKTRLGFDDSDTQPLINNVKEKLQDDFDNKVGELKLEELHIATEQVEVPEGTLLSWDELITKIKEVQDSTLDDKKLPSSPTLSSWLNTSQDGKDDGDSQNSALIDNYISRIDTLKEKLANVSSITQKDLYELSKEFNDTSLLRIDIDTPEGIEKLQNKLAKLANNDCRKLESALKEVEDSIEKKKLLKYFNDLQNSLSDTSAILNGVDSNILSQNLLSIDSQDTMQALNDITASMNALDGAYAEFIDKDTKQISFSALSGLEEQFGNLDSFDKTIKVLGNASSSAKDVQKAFNALATEYVSESGILNIVNEGNKDLIASMLKQMGVANSSSVVNSALTENLKIQSAEQDALNQAKKEAKVSSEDLASAESELQSSGKDLNQMTDEEISAFMTLGTTSDKTKTALKNYLTQKILANAQTIDESGSISSILTFANSLGVTTKAIKEYKEAKSRLNSVKKSAKNGQIPSSVAAAQQESSELAVEKAKEKVLEEGTGKITQKYKKITVSDVKVNYTGGSSSSSAKDKNKKDKDKISKFSEKIDWNEISINTLTKAIARLQSKLENTKGFDAQIKVIDKLIAKQKNLVKSYSKTEKSYKGAYQKASKGLSQSYIKKIENGETFSIESFAGKTKGNKKSSAEKLYNKVTKAQQAYDKWQDAISNKQQADYQLEQYRLDKLQKKVDKYNALIEKNEARLANAIGYKAQNKILNDVIKNQKKSYEYQMKMAKTDTERIKLQQELNKLISDNTKQQFENVKAEYDTKTSLNSAKQSRVQSKIDKVTSKGKIAGSAYYNRMNALSQSERDRLVKETKDLQKELDNAVKSGKIKKSSQEWYEMVSAIYETKDAIDQCDVSMQEFEDSINQIRFDFFDKFNNKVNKELSDMSFLSDLLDYEDLYYNDKDKVPEDSKVGDFTTAGKTKVDLLIKQSKTSEELAKRTKAEIKAIDEKIEETEKEGKSTASLIEQKEKLVEVEQNAISSSKSYLKTAQDIIQDAIQLQIDAYKELIDTENEQLDKMKELHDYEKSISDKTSTVDLLQKRINALQDDDSDEARKQIRQLQKELKEAKDDLTDAQRDKAIEMRKENNNELAEKYEKDKLESIDSIKDILETYTKESKENHEEILKFLNSFIEKEGIILNEGTQDIIDNDASSTSDIIYEQKKDNNEERNKTEINADKAIINIKNTDDIITGADNPTSKTNSTGNAAQFFAFDVGRIESILSKAKKAKSSKGLSTLNDYIYSKYDKKVLSKANQVKLAKELGVTATTKNVESDNISKKIKAALKNAGFSQGGFVGEINDIIKLNNDHGLATVRRDELILKPAEADSFLKLAKLAPDLTNMFNYSIINPNDALKNLQLRSNPQSIDNSIKIEVQGNVTEDVMPKLERVVETQMNKQFDKISRYAYNRGARR